MKTLTFCFILFCTLFFSEKSFSQIDSSWSKRYAGAQNNDEARSMLLDASNNVYVTGRSLSATNGYDIVTVKYNSSGVVLWTAVYNGTGNSTDEGNNIGSDGTNIYVTGVTTSTPSTGLDYVTIKYSASTGNVLWTSIFNGVGNVDDIATKLAIKNNSVYVTGKGYYRNSTDGDYVTIKYKASTGDSILVKTYNGPGNGNDSATFIRISLDSSIFITGKSFGSGNDDFATIKYSAVGTQNWVRRLNGAANGQDFGKVIAFDGNITLPNIYVTGQSQGSGTGNDILTVKYSNSGIETWTKRYNGNGNGEDSPNAFVWKNDNEIYMTGKSQKSASGSDLILLRYDLNGDTAWTKSYNGSLNGDDEGTALAIDLSGFVYVSGIGNESSSGNDYVVIKFTTSGGIEWTYKYNNYGNGSDVASSISVDATTDRNVIVTGASFSEITGINFLTLKLKQDKVLDLNVFVQGFYRFASNSSIRDTVTVLLYNLSATIIIDSAKSYLDTLGKGRFYFRIATNSTAYRIVIHHRNSIETWGNTTNLFSNLYLTYDFTTAATKAYGNNQIQVDISPVEFAIYNGDVNQDGTIDGTDTQIIDNDAYNFTTGYILSDLNGDNFIDGTDGAIGGDNAANFISMIRP